MKRSVVELFAITLFCLGAWCQSDTHPAAKAITEAEQGKSVTLKVGQMIEVRLFSRGFDGGYRWTFPKDSNQQLSLVNQGSEPAPRPGATGPAPPGSPRIQMFNFKAVKKGKGQLRLLHGRSWEMDKGAPPDQTFEVTVEVQ